MTHPERFRAVMAFRPADRLPRIEWASWWNQTIDRWSREGLPTRDRYELYRHFALDPYYQHWFRPRAATFPPRTQHGQCFVNDAADYERLRPHLYPPFDPGIESLRPWAAAQQRGEAVVWITLEGFFWFPRWLFGIEGHLYAFYDQPELMHRMNRELADYHLRLLRRLRGVCRPAFMTFAEDMSYNHGPMLSRQLFDEFMAPYYRRVIPVLREMGTLVLVDTDGDFTGMVPWLESAGVEGALPVERQAGCDGLSIRNSSPRFRMIGHFDKMTMTSGEVAMRAEFDRLLPLMRSGGFIPGVDHQTPPGVSLEQYRAYLRLLAEYSVRGVR